MTSLSLNSLVLSASEAAEHGEPAIHPYVVGAIALAILLAALVALMMFGAGREHS